MPERRDFNGRWFPRGARLVLWGTLLMGFAVFPAAFAQPQPSVMVRHRTRLYLKDHSYQIVMSYRIQGDRVLFVSAERDGAEEDIPVELVDFEATHRWEQEHSSQSGNGAAAEGPGMQPEIDPELLREEAERRALTPEVAPDLRLPEQSSVVALDTFDGTAELVPLTQSEGDLSRTTGHSVLPAVLNPRASAHQIVQLRGEKAGVWVHVNQPVLYVRLLDAPETYTGGTPLTVDTHGASSVDTDVLGGTAASEYVVVHADVRQGVRVISSFHPDRLNDQPMGEEVVGTTTEVLPGGHWMKVTPQTPLMAGEYALMEVIPPRKINLGVWDFGVAPSAPANLEALKPVPRRPVTLERRGPD